MLLRFHCARIHLRVKCRMRVGRSGVELRLSISNSSQGLWLLPPQDHVRSHQALQPPLWATSSLSHATALLEWAAGLTGKAAVTLDYLITTALTDCVVVTVASGMISQEVGSVAGEKTIKPAQVLFVFK